ncbi:MAG: amino acid transporter [Algicola sp.]|nr:amino acid transporter [Algicola sp.]
MSFLPFVQGIGLGASMVIPIGAQNSFVLNQAIKRNYHLVAAAICVFFDICLMGLGVFGGGQLIAANDMAFALITWGGILFLFGYGLLSFKTVLWPNSAKDASSNERKSLKVVVITTLAVTLLNPHVYLDTVVILGSVGGQFVGNEKIAFALGIMLASVMWFTALAMGAAKMSNLLSQPKVKRGIDLVVGIIMWGIAWMLFNDWMGSGLGLS